MPGLSVWWRRRSDQRRRCRDWRTAIRSCSSLVTVALATAAWWLTEDPIRAVAVLVVATPCPLILAVPVALVAGLSRAAHFGVLIKGAKPLEALARVRTLILDKTGTLTDGRPQIVSIDTYADLPPDEVLYFAAAARPGVKAPYGAGDRCRGTRARHGPAGADRHRRSSRRGRRGASWTAGPSSWAGRIS